MSSGNKVSSGFFSSNFSSRFYFISVNSANVSHVYDFGSGKITEVNTLALRSNNPKRVHWFDDEENQINQCYY